MEFISINKNIPENIPTKFDDENIDSVGFLDERREKWSFSAAKNACILITPPSSFSHIPAVVGDQLA